MTKAFFDYLLPTIPPLYFHCFSTEQEWKPSNWRRTFHRNAVERRFLPYRPSDKTMHCDEQRLIERQEQNEIGVPQLLRNDTTTTTTTTTTTIMKRREQQTRHFNCVGRNEETHQSTSPRYVITAYCCFQTIQNESFVEPIHWQISLLHRPWNVQQRIVFRPPIEQATTRNGRWKRDLTFWIAWNAGERRRWWLFRQLDKTTVHSNDANGMRWDWSADTTMTSDGFPQQSTVIETIILLLQSPTVASTVFK